MDIDKIKESLIGHKIVDIEEDRYDEAIIFKLSTGKRVLMGITVLNELAIEELKGE